MADTKYVAQYWLIFDRFFTTNAVETSRPLNSFPTMPDWFKDCWL